MKKLLIILMGVLAMPVYADAGSKDKAQILTAVESFAVLADQNAFEYLGRLFTDEVKVDYTSAFGGEPAVVNNVVLMQQWSGFLPGFDATRHDLGPIDVKIDGDHASAEANIKASHFIGDDGYWQIYGEYQFELEKRGSDWLISSLTLKSEGEEGSRDVLAEAGKHAEANLSKRNGRLVSYQK